MLNLARFLKKKHFWIVKLKFKGLNHNIRTSIAKFAIKGKRKNEISCKIPFINARMCLVYYNFNYIQAPIFRQTVLFSYSFYTVHAKLFFYKKLPKEVNLFMTV